MNENNFFVFYVLVNILSTYTIYRLTRTFLGTVILKKYAIIFYFLYYFTDIVSFLFISHKAIIISGKIVTLLFLTILYEGQIKKKIAVVSIIYLFLIITETMVVLITGYIDLSINSYTNYKSYWGIVSIALLQYILAIIIDNLFNFRQRGGIPFIYSVCVFFVPSANIALILIILQNGALSKNLLVVILFLILSVIFVFFFFYDNLLMSERKKAEMKITDMENIHYKKELESISCYQKSVAAVQHDLKNHFITMQSYLENDQIENALKYVTVIVDNIAERKFIRTGRIEIDSIINYKISVAEQQDTVLKTEIAIPVEFKIKDYDLIIILGNLLDNALEAVKCLPIEDRTVFLNMRYDRKRLIIKTKNKTVNKPFYDKARNPISTKECSKFHGIGISNINKAAARYRGAYSFSVSEDNIYTALILLYVDVQ